MLAGAAPVSVDPVDQTVTFELYDFTAYTGLMAGSYAPCDINQDNSVNAVDVQLVINGALGMDTGYNCDVNVDTLTNAIDVQMVINSALGITKENAP
jgi:hypothetical protein